MVERDPEKIDALIRLHNADRIEDLTDEELVNAARQGREAKKTAEAKAAVELRRRGWTWTQIGRAIGVDQSTAYGWAHPDHKKKKDPTPPAT